MKNYLKNAGQDKLCRVYGALTSPQVPLYGKFLALPGEISVVNREIPPRRVGPPLI